MNTVDVIMPAWPAFLYTNPALGGALLRPLFEYQVRICYLLSPSTIPGLRLFQPSTVDRIATSL